ncbi:hypothetical protein, partial [Siphonobacter sp. BAB-5405]|uniref:tetratricopeptide repeat protein n=1 Tax=Siphonobacter sp. BAB-5405 TaxID=1864825 RepID=UPI0011AF08AC
MELEPEDSLAWQILGDTYLELHKIIQAKEAYKRSYQIDNQNIVAANSYVDILRDYLKEKDEAYQIFKEIEIQYEIQGYPDVKELQLANFAIYDENWGIAKTHWLHLINNIDNNNYGGIMNSWQFSAALAIKLGYGERLLEVFENPKFNYKVSPLYIVIKVLVYNNPDYITNEVAFEARAVALELYKKMTDYISK